jgi:hypothetical protein
MKATRLLLPFTHGIEMDVLEYAVLLAQSHSVTLVALALIYVPERKWSQGARLEHIQQSKDFLEAVRVVVARHGVPVERFEVSTSDVVRSINILVQQLACDGIVLFVRGGDGILLRADEIKRLMEKGDSKLYLMPLPSQKRKKPMLWLRKTIHP